MKIRFSDQNDKSNILKLLHELSEEIKILKPSYNIPKSDGIIFNELMRRKDTMIFVAEENDQLLGLATFYIIPNIRHDWYRGHIEDFVVGKNYRGKGVGSLIMNAVKEYCHLNNIKVIKLDSGLELKKAHGFYKKNGGIYAEKMFRFDID